MKFEIELDRQVLQPGDELLGWLTMDDADVESVEIAFQGEEILGANDVARRFILPVADEKMSLPTKGGVWRKEFRFKIPDDAPPTYASRDIRCEYCIKAMVRRGFWKRNSIQRMHVSVMPATQGELRSLPEELEVEHHEIRLIARLDRNLVLTGESLTGSILLEKKVEDAQLPTKLSFRLAAIEQSTDSAFSHREVLTLDTRDVLVDPEMQLPLVGNFEFPIPSAAEPSGIWNSFKVHYGFRVVLFDHDGEDYRRSTSIRVLRDLEPRRDVPSGLRDDAKDDPVLQALGLRGNRPDED